MSIFNTNKNERNKGEGGKRGEESRGKRKKEEERERKTEEAKEGNLNFIDKRSSQSRGKGRVGQAKLFIDSLRIWESKDKPMCN